MILCMKTLAASLLLLLASTSFAGWNSSGPIGGQVNSVVVAPSDWSVIWAGNSAGIFRSTDGGATWVNVSGPFVDVSYLAVHPANSDVAWAMSGTGETSHIFRTIDGGATWVQSDAGLPSIIPSGIFIDPRNPDTLYAGSHCDPYRFFEEPRRTVVGLASTPQPRFYEAGGVFKSTDGGVTWQDAYDGLSSSSQCAEELAADSFSPWRLFTSAFFGGQWESYDGAKTWSHADGPRPSRGVIFDRRYPFTHYGITARGNDNVVVSQDGGFTWNTVGARPPANPSALSVDPERGRLFLGTSSGVFRSGNGGTVWANTLLPPTGVNALDFGGAPDSLFAATSDGLYRLINRGLGTAVPIDLHDIAANVQSIAVDPTTPDLIYAGTRAVSTPIGLKRTGRLFRSADGGGSWEPVPGADAVPGADFLSVDAAGTVYAAAYTGDAVYRGGRSDASWTVIKSFFGIQDIAADPKTPGTVFVAVLGAIMRSRDFGATWREVTKTMHAGYLAIDGNDSRWVYFGDEYELLRSSDSGDTWSSVEPFDPLKTGTRGIAVAPSNPSVLYRIAANFGRPEMQRSDDRALSWRRTPLPTNAYPTAFAIDPRNEDSVWASTYPGLLYHSTDGGTTWKRAEPPFVTSAPAWSLRFDPTGRVLHAVFSQHGVWELTTE